MKGSGDPKAGREMAVRQWAEAAIADCDHGTLIWTACGACIAHAIEDAVREEREACAALADKAKAECDASWNAFEQDHADTAEGIAVAIRARGAAQDPTPGELSADEIRARAEHDPRCPASDGAHDECQC